MMYALPPPPCRFGETHENALSHTCEDFYALTLKAKFQDLINNVRTLYHCLDLGEEKRLPPPNMSFILLVGTVHNLKFITDLISFKMLTSLLKGYLQLRLRYLPP